MWVQQKIGPFPSGELISFPAFSAVDSSGHPYHYVRVGIQAPQSPYVTETRNVNYSQYYNSKEKVVEPTFNKKKNLPLYSSGEKPENTSYVDKMNKFTIQAVYDSGDTKYYRINENEILEFGDMEWPQYFKVAPKQAMDAYTIIEIQYLNRV